MPQMIIANRLVDGAVVFLAEDEHWVGSIDAGALVENESDTERLLATAKAHEASCIVVDPYLIDVRVEDDRRRPVSNREAIRAFGPTVGTDVDRE